MRTRRKGLSTSLRMRVNEREAFLAESRNAVLSVAEDDGGTIASPVWFLYEPGGVITCIQPERWFTRDYGHAGHRWEELVRGPLRPTPS